MPSVDASVLINPPGRSAPPRSGQARSRGGNGSSAGGIVSEFRIRPSGRWVTNSPPPSFSKISRARSIAARCVGSTALARDAFGLITCQSPSGRLVTCLSFRLLMMISLSPNHDGHFCGRELQQRNLGSDYSRPSPGPSAAPIPDHLVTGGDGPVVVMHGMLMGGTLRDRYGYIVPEPPFGAPTRPMPDDAGRTEPGRAPLHMRASTGVAPHPVHRVRPRLLTGTAGSTNRPSTAPWQE